MVIQDIAIKTGQNQAAGVRAASWDMTRANLWDHLAARWGINRLGHRVEPGLYALGQPAAESPVLVTANYTLSFDALRTSLKGISAYILVVDTQGINVWCAAGKGTFGTDEVVKRIQAVNLPDVVRHRKLILPQLSASGVSACEVEKRTGFQVEFGPVRAADLQVYLKSGQAAPEMRRVHFGLVDRLVLIPVELRYVFIWFLAVVAFELLMRDPWSIIPFSAAIFSGTVLFPILLPWIPTRDFSTKGFILGIVAALPFALMVFSQHPEMAPWLQSLKLISRIMTLAPITAFLALNFTGSTTFTSRTGVRREIFKYIPVMAAVFIIGFISNFGLNFIKT